MADELSLESIDMTNDPRAVLTEAVKGQDDAALTGLAHNLGGTQAFLDLVFQRMTQALDPAKAQDAVVGWEIVDGEDVHPYVITMEGGAATAQRGEPDSARVILRMSLPNFLRLVAGELDGMQAFMSGTLTVRGDMMFAAQIQPMFAV